MQANRFIDSQGRVYYTESLIRAAADLPIIEYEIDLEAIMEQKMFWITNIFRDYLAHYRRVSNADLSKPIILRSDGYVMDGWHRIIKACYLGIKKLPAKQFVIDPEPDEMP